LKSRRIERLLKDRKMKDMILKPLPYSMEIMILSRFWVESLWKLNTKEFIKEIEISSD